MVALSIKQTNAIHGEIENNNKKYKIINDALVLSLLFLIFLKPNDEIEREIPNKKFNYRS